MLQPEDRHRHRLPTVSGPSCTVQSRPHVRGSRVGHASTGEMEKKEKKPPALPLPPSPQELVPMHEMMSYVARAPIRWALISLFQRVKNQGMSD